MLLWLDLSSPFRSCCFGFKYIFPSNAPLSWKRITRGNQLDIIFCIFYIIFIVLYPCFFAILFLYSYIGQVLFSAWINLIYQKSMAPKKKQSQKGESKEKQMKLFSKEVAEEPMKVSKSKSKQFSADQQGEQKTAGTSQGRWSYGSGETPEKLLISSWNVNGIRSVINKQELQNYLTKYKPDVLCIGETKINEEAFDKEKISLQGYNGYWNFCKVSSGYSGVAIFSKYLPISVKEDLPKEEHSQEGRVLTMEFEKFYLVTAYIPNSGQKLKRLDYRMDYDTYFQAHCEKLRKVKPTIVCGDLNVCHRQIDIARPKGNEKTAGFTLEERKSFTDFLEKGWIDSYRKLNPETVKYSWWSMRTKGREKNIGWRLDYFLINEEAWGKIKDSKINNDVFGSDHCPIELEIDLSL